MPTHEKLQSLDRVNKRLASEEIPEVDEEIFRWRMSLVIRDIVAWDRDKGQAANDKDIAVGKGKAIVLRYISVAPKDPGTKRAHNTWRGNA
ncbi:hypothetical protein N0V90_013152 [Kalmusia sp. IMI 367209]|nr:hypothetical protein N0V90_013152 [Kalmusia sp. IMI 367209]